MMSQLPANVLNYRQSPRLWTSLSFLLLAMLCLLLADIDIYQVDPWQEFQRIAGGLLSPDFRAIDFLLDGMINTFTFALLGIGGSCVIGFLLAVYFENRLLRFSCAFIRSIHELFWALLLIQIFGLSPITGILAIAIPYSGIFAKAYAEIIEEASDKPLQYVTGIDRLSRFIYTRAPDVWVHIKSYTLYCLECGLRSSAVLGFIGLPTLGFYLETSFSQGKYSEVWALLLLFYVFISTIRIWMRKQLIPIYLVLAVLLLPEFSPVSFNNLIRFLTHDIIPHPIRTAETSGLAGFIGLADWLRMLTVEQVLPGLWNSLILTQIALVASGLLALLLFPVVSNKFMSKSSRTTGHVALVILRSTPEYILAYMLLQLWGPSMLPAIIAIALHNGAIIAHLTGRYSDATPLPLDAAKNTINRYCYEIVPRLYGQFLAFLFYRWEIIFRETVILGILGIHTLGFFVDSAFQDIRLDRAVYLILITALINIGIDSLSGHLRKRLRLKHTVAN